MKSKCIFHYPAPIELEGGVGSAVRPSKMYNALKQLYDVDVVCGYGAERKKSIERIKNNIKIGNKYDFLYSESLTQPMLLSEKNHIPKYPFLDFNFFKYCRKNNIKIGLFYRDMYWKFQIYKDGIKSWIPYITKPIYQYELKKYEQLVDILYLPSNKCEKYLNLNMKMEALPPGGDLMISDSIEFNEKELKLFYVGGVSGINNIEGLIRTVSKKEYVKITICCPKADWEANNKTYLNYLNSNIKIVHRKGKELEEYYEKADIVCLYYSNNEYRDMAMPIKLFEYIGHGKPIISNSNTAAANFIDEYDLGWIINYDDENLSNLLDELNSNKKDIFNKTQNVRRVAEDNTWLKRVQKIAADLK